MQTQSPAHQAEGTALCALWTLHWNRSLLHSSMEPGRLPNTAALVMIRHGLQTPNWAYFLMLKAHTGCFIPSQTLFCRAQEAPVWKMSEKPAGTQIWVKLSHPHLCQPCWDCLPVGSASHLYLQYAHSPITNHFMGRGWQTTWVWIFH